jgi:hypothetical protein
MHYFGILPKYQISSLDSAQLPDNPDRVERLQTLTTRSHGSETTGNFKVNGSKMLLDLPCP